MSENAPAGEPRHGRRPVAIGGGRSLALLVVAALLVVTASAWAYTVLDASPGATPRLELAAQDDLDKRWGTYLSEREWGNPREAVGSNGWGLSWRGAIDTEYRYSDDGIAALTDLQNEFRIGWAFWDGRQDHVSERFLGATNPQGEAGEEIIDDRIFKENTPTHSYSRMIYRYPAEEPLFEIELESAKVDSNRIALSATVTNLTDSGQRLDVVLKGWLAPGGDVRPLTSGDGSGSSALDALLLHGEDSTVAIVGEEPTSWQISAEKSALDENLRSSGALAGNADGHIGALGYRLDVPADGTRTVRLAFAEGEGDVSEIVARAREVLAHAASATTSRREEANEMFTDDVVAHEDVYSQAVSSLLWNKSYYRWDGASGVNPAWAGRVDAHDVLIVPDKWEFPWPASWDQAFHGVTATLVDAELAKEQIRFLLSERWQQHDGHIPCAEWVMDQECPPIFAWAAWRIFEQTHDRAFLAEVYLGLQRHYDYWWQNQQVGEALFTGGFLGMDNLPRSRGRAQADASAWMAFFARDMAVIASELRDPATERYWVDRGRIQEAINARLWDEETGFYYDLGPGDTFLKQKSYSGLIPLVAGVVPAGRLPTVLAALRDESQFLSVGGIRSLSADSPLYRPRTVGKGINSNWRGPVWLPINYLLIRTLEEIDPGFGAELRDRVVAMVESDWRATGRFHEFFDGDTGEGLGADAQAGWTALVANIIAEQWPAAAPP